MTEIASRAYATKATRRVRAALIAASLVFGGLVLPWIGPLDSAAAAGPCGPPVVNVIACENSLPGTPASDWQITGAGSPTIQGFATTISVNPGDTVRFKINTPSTNYHFDILRLGYYQGNGARKVAAGLRPSATLPQTQPACLTDPQPTGLIDCGNWAVSASWTVPTTAVSGVYIAHLVRDDASGGSHIVFVVRDDSSHSNILFQTSDETWQAYNTYGGNSLYTCASNCPPGNPVPYKGASKVSYNRPFHSAEDDLGGRSWLMYAEYPMIRFLEANGYDVSYTTGIDVGTSTGGSLLTNHKIFMSTGHDEYWAGTQRANVEAARDHGVNLAFFSGNEVFWKTRTEPSIDATNTPNRTLVTYKETHYDGVVDPQDPPTWTGSWADPRFSPPADGGRPQNALTGQQFVVNSGTTDIRVPSQYSKLRFWRNTSIASLAAGQTATLGSGNGTLGFEWDSEPDNGFRPSGLFDLSSTTSTSAEVFTDYGSTTQQGSTATHHLSLYRAPSGALVFGAGTVQWSWGLDSAGGTPDQNMQQATVNLFADMGVQPYALISGLTSATASTDTAPPTSTITSPVGGTTIGDGAKVTITGTAGDTGGVVAGVEVSTDGGGTWHPATGTTSWSYSWVAHGNPSVTLKSRAVDDSGNIETPSAGVTVNVGCTCSIWGTGSVPGVSDSGSATAVEVGVKFKSDVSGTVTGIRFYKSSRNTGTHIGNLWTASGTKLASATFTNESASGWQSVTFATPVPINANTTYVASYFAPAGHTASDDSYLYPNPSPTPLAYSRVDSPPLHALRNTNGTTNGLFQNSATSAFPTGSVDATNYWVDVTFTLNTGPANAPGTPTSVSATAGNASAQVSWNAPSDGGSVITSYTITPFIGATAQTPVTVTGNPPSPTATVSGLTNGTAYTFTVTATNSVGTGPPSAASNSVTPVAVSCAACTIWPASTTPSSPDEGDGSTTEVGVKFTADVNGTIKGIRFYKATANTGTHIGNLWTASGTKLASATFSNETATGWQQVNFATPVSITAGSVYVASYFAPNGHYAGDGGYFAAAGVDNGPLHALRDGVSGGNGVYRYGSSSAFPSSTFNSENYWVDVVFSTGPATAPAAPTNATATAGNASALVSWAAPPSDGGSAITSYTVTPFIGPAAQTPVTVSGNPPATSTTVTGLTNGTAYTFTVTATNGVGTSPASAASSPVTPAPPTAPGAPTNVIASAGSASAQLSWTAPANGGSAITSYTVTPFIGAAAQTPVSVPGNPPATSTTATGLTNGTTYTFTVTATNAIGAGPASAASNPVTPTAVSCSGCTIFPTNTIPPTPDENDPAATELGVKFTADANGTITGIRFYKATANTGTHIGNLWTASGTKLASATFTNETAVGWQQVNFATPVSITAGTVYVASYFAPNGHYAGDGGYFANTGVDNGLLHALRDGVSGGNGVYLYASSSGFPISTFESENYWVDVLFSTGTATAPGAPTNATATASNGSAQVSWTAPANGGSAITSYAVTPFIGATAQTPVTVTGNPPATSTTVNGLTNGTTYTFTVTATNAVGAGPASTASNAVTPTGPPGAPTAVAATAGNGSAQVSWTAPVSDGGSAITSYTVTPFVGATAQTPVTVTGSPPATSTTVNGLTNGTAYTFTVKATNGVGAGPASTASNSVTPAGPPATPTGVNATAGNGSAAVSWTAPANGGSAITSYTVTPFVGATAQTPVTVSGSPPATSTTVNGLTNGTAYTFTVAATNAVGTGPASAASNAVTPTGTPAAPTSVTATAGNGSAQVSWTAPLSDGGSAITSYTVTPFIGATAQTPVTVTGNPPATSTTVNGLTNGTAYTFKVTASNAVGSGSASAASNAVTPTGPPGAPTAVAATAGNGSAQVSWTAPANDGGSAITSYTVTPFIGATAQTPVTVSGSPPATSTTVNGLTNGTTYTFTVTATNSLGTGPASAASNAVTPVGSPGAPTSVNATAGNGSAQVSWTAPANGGSAITSYTVTPFIGATAQTPVTVSGNPPAISTTVNSLTNGTAYTFTVSATNTIGTGAASTPSNSVTPVGSPGAPTSVNATAGDGSAQVNWTAPLNDGGSAITSYTVTPFVGATAQTPVTVSGSPPATSTTVNGLTNGTAYTFKVTASNALGSGTTSTASNSVTPVGSPGAPTSVNATAGNGSAQVSWTAPTNGGSAITSYTVTPFIGTTAQTPVTVSGNPPATSTTVNGLTNGTAYTFIVTATNSLGTGPASAASNSVTPVGSPGAPTGVTATAGDGAAQVSWTAPVSDGGSAISSYTVTPFIGATAQTSVTVSGNPPAISTTVNGLTNGTAYTFKVTASNALGSGTTSTASNSVTPVGSPGAPTGVTATAGAGSAQVGWTAPVSDGGSAITSYTVTPFIGATAQTSVTVTGNPPATSTTVNGLTNGTTYTFTVTASNTIGTGSASTPSNSVTPAAPASAPDAPTAVSATAGNSSAQVSWTAPANDGGSPITSYTVTPFIGATAQTPVTVTGNPPATSTTVNDLSNGTAYTFTVTATNTIGTGAASTPSNSVTPVGSPGAPTSVNATAGDASAQVNWTAPVSDGGSPINSYTVTPFIGTTAQSPVTVSGNPPATSTTVNGLTNGTAYTFKVTATNAVGTGPASAASTSVVPTAPPGAPGAPTSVTATGGDGSALVTWTAPANDGGSPITSYTVTPFIGTTAQTPVTVTGNPPATSTTVNGLTNGTAYAFTVTATNAVGTGPASTQSNSATPLGPPTAPGAPTNVTATGGASAALVSWTAPADGGSAITSYTVTPFIGITAQTPVTLTGSPPATGTIVNGLTNGTAYTFTVTATNAVGTGPASTPSNSVTPLAAPNAPSAVTAIGGNGSALVSWSAPASDGGSPVTSYTVTPFIGATAQTPVTVTGNPPATSTTVNGLTNGTAYTFTVKATNAVGTGTASTPSNGVTPTGPPGAPTGVTATAGNGSAQVTWTAPASNGGSAITSYTVTPFIGTTAQTPVTVSGSPPATSTTVNGLTNGTAYTFTVTASNSVGAGSASGASNSVTPTGPPGVPTGVTATAGNGSAQVTWTAPASNGGSPITSYTVTPFIGTTAQTPVTVTGNPPATSTTVNGLTNGTTYTFTVKATNVLGTGAASAASNPVTLPTAPAAPTGVIATAGNGSAQVTWTAPANGGSAITSYTVTPFIGTTAQTPVTVTGNPPATSTTVNGLTNGTAYTFKVTATNAIGTSPASVASSSVTPAGPPAAPTSATAIAGKGSAQVSWTAPANGGSAITSYTVTPFVGATAQTPVTVTGNPPATSTTVNGLTNGTAYIFTVKATNAVGTGPASAASSSVTPVACTACTIWAPTATPTTPTTTRSTGITVGVKFRSDVNGSITGIRFYKGTGNTGTHIATLWTTSGTKLATATFTNETASGWQQVNFATPVPITAGTVYIATYYAPNGHTPADSGYFTTSGVDTGPLHALRDGVSGGNGVFKNNANGFPNSSTNATNYWVDVVLAN
jgi:hypothetical protein